MNSALPFFFFFIVFPQEYLLGKVFSRLLNFILLLIWALAGNLQVWKPLMLRVAGILDPWQYLRFRYSALWKLPQCSTWFFDREPVVHCTQPCTRLFTRCPRFTVQILVGSQSSTTLFCSVQLRQLAAFDAIIALAQHITAPSVFSHHSHFSVSLLSPEKDAPNMRSSISGIECLTQISYICLIGRFHLKSPIWISETIIVWLDKGF